VSVPPKKRPGSILRSAPRSGQNPFLDLAKQAPVAPRPSQNELYDKLEPAVRDLVATKGYTVRSAIDFLLAAHPEHEERKATIYRAICWRIKRAAAKRAESAA
jgi:hypothetical protein